MKGESFSYMTFSNNIGGDKGNSPFSKGGGHSTRFQSPMSFTPSRYQLKIDEESLPKKAKGNFENTRYPNKTFTGDYHGKEEMDFCSPDGGQPKFLEFQESAEDKNQILIETESEHVLIDNAEKGEPEIFGGSHCKVFGDKELEGAEGGIERRESEN